MNQSHDDSQQFVSLLVEDGLIQKKDWQMALAIQQNQGGRLIEILMGLCPISEEALYQSIARQLSLPFWSEHELANLPIPATLLHQFPLFLMMEHSFLPIKRDDALHIVLPNPLDKKTLEAIQLYAQVSQLAIGISTPSSVVNAIQLHYKQTMLEGAEGDVEEDTSVTSAELAPILTSSDLPSADLFPSTPSSGYGISPPKIEIRACPACEHPEPIYNERCSRCGSPLNLAQADPLLGKQVGRFRLDKKLGEGGMGLVYAAQDLENGQEAAVKILRTHLSTNERVVRRFHREARAQNELRHPNIVYVHDFGFEEGVGFFIAMEFLRGQSLDAIIEEHADILSLDLIRSIFQQVCDAMGFAHSRGIFHRDLKPDNIFLMENPWREPSQQRIKILDFGVAKMIASEEDQRLTRTGMTIGTPRYMAPEQAGEGDSDHRADIYSLGVILFEVLTGKPPFEGSSAYQIMLRHVYADPPSLSHVRKDLPYPPALEELLHRTLAKDPQDRPHSMDMLWRELNGAMDRFSTFISPDLPLLQSSHMPAGLRDNLEPAPSTLDRPVIVGRMLDDDTPAPVHQGAYSSDSLISASHADTRPPPSHMQSSLTYSSRQATPTPSYRVDSSDSLFSRSKNNTPSEDMPKPEKKTTSKPRFDPFESLQNKDEEQEFTARATTGTRRAIKARALKPQEQTITIKEKEKSTSSLFWVIPLVFFSIAALTGLLIWLKVLR